MRVFSYQSLDSTQEKAFQLSSKNPKYNNFLVTTQEQTKGYGRRGAVWQQGTGNLYASFCIRLTEKSEYLNPDISQNEIKLLPIDLHFAVSLSIYMSILSYISDNYKPLTLFKWPNDILINNKKLAGIISEFRKQTLVVGFGINTVRCPRGLESGCYLAKYSQSNIINYDIIDLFYSNFCLIMRNFIDNPLSLSQSISKILAFRSERREIKFNQGKIFATILDINKDYSLEIVNHNNKDKKESLHTGMLI